MAEEVTVSEFTLLLAEVSVTFLHEKAGAEKRDKHRFFFTIPFDPAV